MPTISLHAGVSFHPRSLSFRTSRSSGPGGQNVNKLDTRVEVLLPIGEVKGLDKMQEVRLRRTLGKRVDGDGVIHVSSQKYRSQYRNKQDAIDRLVMILVSALKTQSKRRPTKPGKTAVERRLHSKRRRSEVKRRRLKTHLDQD